MNMQSMMKQMQKMQKDMTKAQNELQAMTFTGNAQNLVKIEVNGAKEVLKVDINEDILTPEDKEMIEDMIVTALQDAFKQVDNTTNDKMGAFTKGMNVPGLF